MMIQQSAEKVEKDNQTLNIRAQNKGQYQVQNVNKSQQGQNNNRQEVSANRDERKQKQTNRLEKLPCINKICPKYKSFMGRLDQKKPKRQFSQQQLKFSLQKLCRQCLRQFEKKCYCIYCKQIYFDTSDEGDDGKLWIQCQGCQRWVHTQCANFDSKDNQSHFKCIKCKNNDQLIDSYPNNIKKQSLKNTQNKNNLQRKKNTECSLNAFGFYWQLEPKQLTEDLNRIRQYLT